MKKFSVFLALLCLTMCISTTSLAAKFYDTKGTEYEGMVDRIAALGIINGISEKTFAPNKGLTRAEFAKIITYTKGMQKFADETDLPSKFKDVKKNHWAKNYIMVAEDMGFLKGYEDGTFRPEQEVTYAEFIAITLRVLGYVNIDETSGSTWYSGYIKRMIEIDLHKGMPEFKSYDAPAKRGDVAIMWWNMLVSDRWAIDAQSEGSGLHYTYSSKTQLEFLFPDFIYVRGTINGMYNPRSGDMLGVQIGYSGYKTQSNVPLYALGAKATGLYDPDTKLLYGLAIDENFENYKWVSGPIFYLEEQGIKLKSAKTEDWYGSKNDANYAYVLLSKEDNSVLRVVYLDASESWVVNSVKLEEPKDEDGNKSSDDNDEEDPYKLVYINGSEEAITSNNAIIIVNGEKIAWEDIPEDAVLTELIKDRLYTIETKTISGVVTNYDKMSDLYIDYDRYIVADGCIYTIYGENESEDGKKTDKLKTYKYSSLKKKKFEELLPRKITYRLNVAEEIQSIEFGRYKPSSIIDKYDNGDYRFFFIDSLGYTGSGEENATIGGKSFGGKVLRYKVKDTDDLAKGAFVFVGDLDNGNAGECRILDSSNSFDDDLALEYDIRDEYSYGGFGEYAITDDTLVFQVLKYYKENSLDEVEKVTMQRVECVEDIENLDKYKIHLLYNEEMNIDIVLAERELNKAVYPVGRIMEIWNYSPDDDSDADKKLVKVKVGTVGDASFVAVAYEGDCQWGELVTYDPETKEDFLVIKERFRTEFLGYKGDIVIETASKRDHIATVVGESNILDLREQTYEYKGKTYDLLDYKYLLTTVRHDSEYDSWGFMLTKFYEKEDLELKAGDRIAFNELNGIAVIYRGYTD